MSDGWAAPGYHLILRPRRLTELDIDVEAPRAGSRGIRGQIMPGLARALVGWQGATAGVNAYPMRRASERVEIIDQRDDCRFELTTVHAPQP